jgi:hypothetical protein
MDRETKAFVTASSKPYVLKSYLTFAELEPLLSITDKFAQSSKIVEAMLISFENDTKDAYARIRNLPAPEYIEISVKATELFSAGFPKEK